MKEEKILTEAMREQVGRHINVQVTPIDRRLVDQYLEATGDPNEGEKISTGSATIALPSRKEDPS
jgi:hypothetical protein